VRIKNMANATKNLVKKMNDEIKNAIKKIKAKQKRENIIFDIVCSLAVLLCLLYFVFGAVVNKTNGYSFALAMLSMIVTFSFEGYEWIYLFKKNKQTKHSLLPCMVSLVLTMFFVCIVVCLQLGISTFENFDNNNLLCALSLFIYVLLVTIRKIIEDLKA